MIFDRIIFSN